jgi:hypothetical protein
VSKDKDPPQIAAEPGTHHLPALAPMVHSSAAPDAPCAVIFEPDASANGIVRTAETLVTSVQAAQLFHRTTRTLRNWEARGLLPGVRIGRSLYFKLSDIERLCAGGEAIETEHKTPAGSSGSTDFGSARATSHDENPAADDGA